MKKKARKLKLHRETLRGLEGEDLKDMAGGYTGRPCTADTKPCSQCDICTLLCG